jgi:hypothetical protein
MDLSRALELLKNKKIHDGQLRWRTDDDAKVVQEIFSELKRQMDLAQDEEKQKLQPILHSFGQLTANQLCSQLEELQGVSRRDVLKGVALAATVSATGLGATAAYKMNTDAQPLPKWNPDPGFYVLLHEGPDAEMRQQHYRPSVILRSAGQQYLIVPQCYKTFLLVHDLLIPMQMQSAQRLGIIRLLPNGRVEHLQTLYDLAYEKSKELHGAPRTPRAISDIVSRAVSRYPLTGDRRFDQLLVEALIFRESSGDPQAQNGGASGLMQLEVPTWEENHKGKRGMRHPVRFHRSLTVFHPNAERHKCNIFDPEQNIDAGVHYLSELFGKLYKKPSDIPTILLAYNAGPGSVARWLKKENPFEYAQKVLGLSEQDIAG